MPTTCFLSASPTGNIGSQTKLEQRHTERLEAKVTVMAFAADAPAGFLMSLFLAVTAGRNLLRPDSWVAGSAVLLQRWPPQKGAAVLLAVPLHPNGNSWEASYSANVKRCRDKAKRSLNESFVDSTVHYLSVQCRSQKGSTSVKDSSYREEKEKGILHRARE